jgi:hypothetical protein
MVTIIKRGTSKVKIKEILDHHAKKRHKSIDLSKYCGIIELKEDPLKIQKQWRDEWE